MEPIINKKKYDLLSALMVYGFKQGGRINPECYLEIHAVKDGKLMAGKPLTQSGINQLSKIITTKTLQGKSIFPTNLIFCSPESLLWFTPATERSMFFTENLCIPDGKAWVPALLWSVNVHTQTVSLFAMKSSRRPTENTRLYMAPFHNVYASGSVCMGSAKLCRQNRQSNAALSEKTVNEQMATWEAAFWNSKFSHLVAPEIVKKKFNINLIWKDLIQTGKKFPSSVLKEAPFKTLGEWIERMK